MCKTTLFLWMLQILFFFYVWDTHLRNGFASKRGKHQSLDSRVENSHSFYSVMQIGLLSIY